MATTGIQAEPTASQEREELEVIKVMITDGPKLIRSALTNLLHQNPRISVVATADGIDNAERVARGNRPDVVIFDPHVPVTADELTVQALTRAAGFSFRWNEAAQEWSHGSAAIVLTPQAKISRYVHGIAPEAQTLKWAMSEATQGRVGNLLDQISWLCMTYDPKLSKYTLYAFRLVQLGGGLMILFLGFLLIPQIFRSRRQRIST